MEINLDTTGLNTAPVLSTNTPSIIDSPILLQGNVNIQPANSNGNVRLELRGNISEDAGRGFTTGTKNNVSEVIVLSGTNTFTGGLTIGGASNATMPELSSN